MMRSLAGRLTLLQQLMALSIVLVFAGSALWLTSRVLRSNQMTFLNRTARDLAAAYDDELKERRDPVKAARTVLDEGAAMGVHVQVMDAAGRTLASATPRRAAGASGGPQPMFRTGAASGSGARITVAIPGRLHASALSALAEALLIAALPLLMLSVVLSHFVVRRALRPLDHMTARASQATAGVRSVGEPTGLVEIDRLSESFNNLIARLDDALRSERRLTADASHELRTPLMVLGGELELARTHVASDSRTARELERCLDQVRTMSDLVEALLLLRRTDEGTVAGSDGFEIVNLCDLARDGVAEMAARYPERARDVELCAPDEIMVYGHPVLLAAALRNLLDNAFKFSTPGTPVRVAVAAREDLATATVDDGGPGIAETDRARVFDPFYRGAEARADRAGFGLGLPILRRVARSHGGDVDVGASPQGGARFELMLPRLQPERGAGRVG